MAAFVLPAAIVTGYGLNEGGSDVLFQHQAALAIWWVVGVGVLVGLFPLSRPPQGSWLPVVALLALAGWITLSLTWTESAERTYADLGRVLHYLGLLVLAWCLLGRGTWRAAAAGVTSAAALVCIVAVASRLAPSVFPDDVSQEVFHSERLGYPLGYWNALAAWAAMSFAALVSWTAHARGNTVRSFAAGVAPLVGSALYLTYSRGGLLAAAVGLLAVVLLAGDRWRAIANALVALVAAGVVVLVIRINPEIASGSGGAGGGIVALALAAAAAAAIWLSRRIAKSSPPRMALGPRARSATVAALLVGLLVAAMSLGPQAASTVSESFTDQERAESDPAARLGALGGARHELWSTALEAFEKKPLNGIGPGTFEFWWTRTEGDPSLVRDAHSLYFESLAEIGVVGFLIVLAFVGSSLWLIVRARRGLTRNGDIGAAVAMIAVFGAFAVGAGLDWLWEVPAVSALAIIALAIGLAAAPRPLGRRRRRWPIVPLRFRLPLAAAAIMLGALQIPGLASTERIRASEAELESGDRGLALALADDAVDAEPWAASPHAQRALIFGVLGDDARSREEMEEAIDAEPTNWRHQLLLAVLEFESGDFEAANAAYDEARELRPGLPLERDRVLPALSGLDVRTRP